VIETMKISLPAVMERNIREKEGEEREKGGKK